MEQIQKWITNHQSIKLIISTSITQDAFYKATRQYKTLYYLDYVCTSIFTVDLFLRFFLCPEKCKFCKDPLNIADSICLFSDWFIYFTRRFFDVDIPNSRDFYSFLYAIKVLRVGRVFKVEVFCKM